MSIEGGAAIDYSEKKKNAGEFKFFKFFTAILKDFKNSYGNYFGWQQEAQKATLVALGAIEA
ncbi:hypothetical protein [Egbenema bharatensis]|uniref:hypothetical protein n=1 Tax=Egbenema bharatensis TaxID=3463334 RepID=UPI003A897301